MKLLTLVYVFCLFYALIPGNIIKLPLKTSKMNIILIHALLFSAILYFTYPLIENNNFIEGYGNKSEKKTEPEEGEEEENDDEKKMMMEGM